MNQTVSKVSVEIPRFIMVGSFAAGVHILSLFILVSLCEWSPLVANVLAFGFAFIASFSGHHYWTFNTTAQPNQALWKFFLIAVLSFTLNQSLFYLLLVKYHFYYLTALILVLLFVPPLTFILSKCWAFRARVVSCE